MGKTKGSEFIPQMEPWYGEEERKAVSGYMSEGGWITEFKRTTQFEQIIAEFTGAKHCIVTNNGTISLTLAALACGIEPGDEVIVPNYTMIATPNSMKLFGAVPVFVDVEPQTLCMDIDLAKRAVTARTKAIIVVNANGRYPKSGIEKFVELARDRNLVLIEDAAQSLGSSYPDGRHQGTVGLAGSFSFSSPKIISTGQGGAVVTNDDEIAYKLRRLKDFGRSGGGLDIHDSIGYNFKFTDIQACIGIEQMKKLSWRVQRKRQIWKLYKSLLAGIDEMSLFDQDLEYTTPWFIDILAEKRDGLQLFLNAKGIGTRAMYPPINKQVAYRLPGEYPVSNRVGTNGLWLPSASQLTDGQISHVCEAIRHFYK